MRCLLIGNYGTGNLGDEALKEYFLTRFPTVEWTVLSASPQGHGDVPRLPFGIRSLLTTPWWRSLGALRRCDAVVFGGGSLFTDIESGTACLLWWWHAFVARIYGKPVLLAFQGIGPFRTAVGEWCAGDVLKRAVFVSVRDEESGRRARGRARARIIVSFDPVLVQLTAERVQSSGSILGVIPRQNSGEEFRRLVMASVARDSPQSVRILSMQPESSSEREFCDSLARDVGNKATIVAVRSLSELSRELAQCSCVITARYHGALAALALGLPMEIVPQREGDKLDALRSVSRADVERLRTLVVEGEQELLKSLNML